MTLWSKARLVWDFLKVRKKWWLAPVLVLLLFVGVLIVLSPASPLAPFIYSLF